jgi:hypothetical protein
MEGRKEGRKERRKKGRKEGHVPESVGKGDKGGFHLQPARFRDLMVADRRERGGEGGRKTGREGERQGGREGGKEGKLE